MQNTDNDAPDGVFRRAIKRAIGLSGHSLLTLGRELVHSAEGNSELEDLGVLIEEIAQEQLDGEEQLRSVAKHLGCKRTGVVEEAADLTKSFDRLNKIRDAFFALLAGIEFLTKDQSDSANNILLHKDVKAAFVKARKQFDLLDDN